MLIGYAILCNVMLITILISILSNLFADINANAQAEVRTSPIPSQAPLTPFPVLVSLVEQD